MRVSELDPEQRPRERLLARGPETLTDEELLAVLLRTGWRGEGVLELARAWLEESGGLRGLMELPAAAILGRRGVGAAKGAIVLAALELARRVARERLENRPLLGRPALVAAFLQEECAGQRTEVFGYLLLDSRHRLQRVRRLHTGSRTGALVEPAEVFRDAILTNAHAIIVWHFHPSGDPTPSADDVELTRQLAQAGELLNIKLVDHLVVARGGWVSLREQGMPADTWR